MNNPEVQTKHSSDVLGWVSAGIFSLAALRFRYVTGLGLGTREFACLVALFLAGLVVGAFVPRRSWRWALAGFAAFGLSDLVHLGNRPRPPELELHDWLSLLAGGAPIWALHALPVLAGAYLGAYLSREHLP